MNPTTRMRVWGLAAFLLLAPRPAEPLPAGYTLEPRERALENWEETSGDFTVSIRREAPDSLSAWLLDRAESTYPPRDLLVGIAAERNYEIGSDSASVPLWWSRGVGPSRVPYAVTAGAVDHYARLTERYRRREFRASGTRPLFGSELFYRGAIGRRDEFVSGAATYRDVYVAHLHLVWSWDDGVFDIRTEARRVVVLSREGEVLAVEGDGLADEDVAISGWRDARPRQARR